MQLISTHTGGRLRTGEHKNLRRNYGRENKQKVCMCVSVATKMGRQEGERDLVNYLPSRNREIKQLKLRWWELETNEQKLQGISNADRKYR